MKKFQAHHKLMALSSVALAGMLTLNACGSTNTNSDSSASATSSSSAAASGSAQSSSGPIKIENTWAKATDGGMTGVFGKITNTSDHDVKVVSATSTATDEVQLHTTVKDSNGSTKMQHGESGGDPGVEARRQPHYADGSELLALSGRQHHGNP